MHELKVKEVVMPGTLVEILLTDGNRITEEIMITRGTGRGQRYVVVERRITTIHPQPGEVFAELILKKPRGEIIYAADQIFIERKVKLTGIPFLDEGAHAQPDYDYVLRPDRELAQGAIVRKIQEKSPCCNRTMYYIGAIRTHKRYCRKCGKEVV